MYTQTAPLEYNYWLMPVIERKPITPQDVIKAACKVFDISVSYTMLTSKKRTRILVRVRNICMYIMRNKLKLPLTLIGKLFNRDHTTVMHSVQYVENELSVMAYRQQMNEDLRRVMELI